jgi:putative Mn2+ efflux pump MntP
MHNILGELGAWYITCSILGWLGAWYITCIILGWLGAWYISHAFYGSQKKVFNQSNNIMICVCGFDL